MAKSRRQRAPSITTGIPPTSDMKLPMSVFPRFTSGVGGKAAVVRDSRLRPLLTHFRHRGYFKKRGSLGSESREDPEYMSQNFVLLERAIKSWPLIS
jgi:hypothetical protein